MRFKQTNSVKCLRLFLCLLGFVTFITNTSLGQQVKSIYKTTLLYDTVVANNNKDFIFNNINISNLTTDKISILVTITPPESWQLVTQSVLTYQLEANGNTIIPLRLLPGGSNTAKWQYVRIEYRLNNGLQTTTDSFKVRVQEFTKFKAFLPAPAIVLAAYQKTVSFPVSIKNSGNTAGQYVVNYRSELFHVDEKIKVSLGPGKDTAFHIPLRLLESEWAMLRKEDIKVAVSNENGETYNLFQAISKVGYVLKEKPSAYLDMPLQFETGVTYQGGAAAQYYGALHGNMSLSEKERIAFDARSNTFSAGQVVDNHILRAEYTSVHWNLVAGNVMELTDFIMDGYGGKVGYGWKEKNKGELYGMFKSRSGDSKLAGGNLQFAVNDNFALNEQVTANFDTERKLNSFIARQGADIKLGERGKLNLNLGAGLEQFTGTLADSSSASQAGTSMGYTLQWGNDFLSANSTFMYNSNTFPGIFKGQRLQIHDVRAMFKRAMLGAFYEYNFRMQNFYTDTSLFSDVFNLRTENYGARLGYSLSSNNFIVSAGRQLQFQPSDTVSQNYIYDYLNLNATVLAGKFYLTTNSYIGKGSMDKSANSNAFVSSNQGTIQYRFAGLTLRYDNGPYYYHDYVNYIKNPTKYERLILSPYTELNFFKNSLIVRTQFNYAKTMPENNINSNLITNVVYTNAVRGFDFSMAGILPFNQENTQPYVSASVRVRLHTPFIFVRKYYTLKLMLYKDGNTNGRWDPGEEPVIGQTLAINGTMFVSDERGFVIFKNIDKGDYKTDFGYSSKIRGWIPNGGTIQHFNVNGNESIRVPYKVSRVLQGKLTLNMDQNSNLSFNLGNIKVSATSLLDTINYSTITDSEGEFYFNLPEGDYIVTLNESAFDENFKPTEYSQKADLRSNMNKTVYFEVKQKKREINIRKK